MAAPRGRGAAQLPWGGDLGPGMVACWCQIILKRGVLEEYRVTVEKELQELCGQILKMLEKTLIENSTGTEEKVLR